MDTNAPSGVFTVPASTSRHFLHRREPAWTWPCPAARQAMTRAGLLQRRNYRVCLVATFTHRTTPKPSTACLLQREAWGWRRTRLCFRPENAAAPAFSYAENRPHPAVRRPRALAPDLWGRRVISSVMDHTDRKHLCPLLGRRGLGRRVVRREEETALAPTVFGSRGDRSSIPGAGPGPVHRHSNMTARRCFRFCRGGGASGPSASCLRGRGVPPFNDLEAGVCHQANGPNHSTFVSQAVGSPGGPVFYKNMGPGYGQHLSAASIPIALLELTGDGAFALRRPVLRGLSHRGLRGGLTLGRSAFAAVVKIVGPDDLGGSFRFYHTAAALRPRLRPPPKKPTGLNNPHTGRSGPRSRSARPPGNGDLAARVLPFKRSIFFVKQALPGFQPLGYKNSRWIGRWT